MRGVPEEIETKFTLEQAAKIRQLNHPMKSVLRHNILVNEASDTEIDQFISINTQPKVKNKGRTRNSRRYWSSSCTWKLKQGKPVFFDGRLINPTILDISNLRRA